MSTVNMPKFGTLLKLFWLLMIWQCLIFQSGSGGKFEETSGTRYDTMVAERLCKKGKTDRKIMMASFYIIKDKCKDGLMSKKAKDISGISKSLCCPLVRPNFEVEYVQNTDLRLRRNQDQIGKQFLAQASSTLTNHSEVKAWYISKFSLKYKK